MTPDYIVRNEGSVMLVAPQNERATRNLTDNLQDDAQWFGNAVAVEPRYIEGLADALVVDGFTVEWEGYDDQR